MKFTKLSKITVETHDDGTCSINMNNPQGDFVAAACLTEAVAELLYKHIYSQTQEDHDELDRRHYPDQFKEEA